MQTYEFDPDSDDPPTLVKGQALARHNGGGGWTPDSKRMIVVNSRALFSAPPTTEAENEAHCRRPHPPLRRTVTGCHPLLRLIGRDDLDLVQPWIDDWAPIVAEWLRAGLSPFVFTHTPNDFFAVEFAQRFHRRLSELVPTLPPLPKPPAELHS